MAEWHRIITSPYTGSMSMSGSFNVDGNATITGNVTINGTASVENLVVKQIGYSSGSNQLGDAIDDVQSLYGTVVIPTGSLVVNGNMNFSGSRTIQPLTASLNTKGPTLTLLGGLAGATSGNGGDIVIKGGNGINTGNTGGDVYIQGGDRTGAQRSGDIYIGNASGQYQIYLQGAPIFTWDGPNASNAIILRRGGSTRFLIYDDVNLTSNYYFRGGSNTINAIWDTWNSVIVKGKGTTSSTTSFLVQNANASSSLIVTDDRNVEIQGGLTVTGTTGSWIIEARGTSNSGGIRRVGNNVEFFGLNYIGSFLGGYGSLNIRGYSGGSTGNTTTAAATIADGFNYNASSVNTPGLTISPAINQTGTGTFTLLNFAPTFNTTGSGVSYYISSSNYVVTSLGNVGIKTGTPSASLHVVGNTILSGSASTSSAALLIYKSGSTVLDVQGSSGQLFSVTDSLTGSLFSVNTVAGLPVIEAFSDNTVNIGKYGTYPIKVVSLGTSAVISGSFSGSGANLSGIPASGIVGLNLSQIATGSITASVSLGTGSFTITSGSSNFFFVSSSGNVGIGTTTPARLLHVSEGGTRLYQTFAPGVPTLYVYHGRTENDSTVRFENGSGDNLYFGGNGLFVTGNTNIGSGTTLLGARLGVRGSGTTSSTTALLIQNANASSSLAVLDNGFVGIGISSPTAPLYINYATASSTELVIDNSITSTSGPESSIRFRTAVSNINKTSGIISSKYTSNGYGATSISLRPATGNEIVEDVLVANGNKSVYIYGTTTPAAVSNYTVFRLNRPTFGGPAYGGTVDFNLGMWSTANAPSANTQLQIRMSSGLSENADTNALTINASASLALIGINTTTPSASLDVSGSGRFTNGLTITGSLTATSLTASSAVINGNVTVLGTASISTLIVNQIGYSSGSNQLGDAVDDTQTLYGTVRIPTGSLTVTGSTIISSSAATQLQVGNNSLFVSSSGNVGIGTTTPSVALNVVGHLVQNASGYGIATNTLLNTRIDYYQYAGHQFRSWGPAGSQNVVSITGQGQRGKVGIMFDNPTASLHVAGDVYVSASAGTGSALTVYKSGSTVMSIQGSQGELFSITDSLSGSLFSVSNISGLPILEVFSDNTVLLGSYLDPMLITTQRLTANSGSTVIYSLPTASYDGVFVDYVIRSGSNARAGQFMGLWSGSSTNVVDSSTTDFGDTSGFVLALVVSGSNMVITGSASTSAWTVRAGIRSI